MKKMLKNTMLSVMVFVSCCCFITLVSAATSSQEYIDLEPSSTPYVVQRSSLGETFYSYIRSTSVSVNPTVMQGQAGRRVVGDIWLNSGKVNVTFTSANQYSESTWTGKASDTDTRITWKNTTSNSRFKGYVDLY